MKVSQITPQIARRLRDDGIFFCEKILGTKLHYYQKEVMNEHHKYIAMCWGRQLGKTTLLSFKATHYAVTNPNKLIMILSQDRERAREFYNLIIGHILGNPLLANMIVGDAKQSETKLSNGTRLINKAAGRDGRSLRGFSVDLLIIDEADFVPEPVFIAGEQCTASVRGAIWLISTPFRKGTTFHKYFTDGQLARGKYEGTVPLDEDEERPDSPIGQEFDFLTFHHDYRAGLQAFKEDGLTQIDGIFIKKKQKSMERWAFEQEYLAKWSDDIASYFNEKQIRACLTDLSLKEEDYIEYGEVGQTYYMGVDFAKHKDKTMITTIKRLNNGQYQVVRVDVWEGRDWDKQIIDLNHIVGKINPAMIYIDKTGVGDVMLDFMKNMANVGAERNHMQGKIEPINFAIQTKTTLYSHLQNMIGNRMLHLPLDKKLLAELIFIQYEKTPASEWVRIHAPTGMYDDFPDSLALAIQGSVSDVLFIPVHLQGIVRALAPKPEAQLGKLANEFGMDKDGDAWELMQLAKGATIHVDGKSFNKYAQKGKKVGTYRRKNLKR